MSATKLSIDAVLVCDVFSDGGETIIATPAGLARVAVVAANAAAAFGRERGGPDPAAWMLAPRRAFGGNAAVSACLDPRDFRRALALIACAPILGTDADPDILDELIEDDGASAAEGSAVDRRRTQRHCSPAAFFRSSLPEGADARDQACPARLFSSGFTRYESGGMVACFVAAIAADERDFRNRLFARFGAMTALGASVREGFDRFDDLAIRLVADPAADRLEMLAAAPELGQRGTFVFVAEQDA